MKYIVFDLEWNQGYSSKEESERPLPFEIIEIGAVKLDEDFKIIDSFHRIIKPVVYTELFKYTKELIPLTEKDLSKGILKMVQKRRQKLLFCHLGNPRSA